MKTFLAIVFVLFFAVLIMNRAEQLTPAVQQSYQVTGDLPLMIRWSQWKPEFGFSYVYARERDLAGMLQMTCDCVKMLMGTSYDEVARLIPQLGNNISIVGINTENGQGMTPANEMATIFSPDPNTNVVARVCRLAVQNSYECFWGPIRVNIDKVSSETIAMLKQNGVTGIAMQEQKFIETQPAQERYLAVTQTINRYNQSGNFKYYVQIMEQRCPNLANCVEFVRLLRTIPIDGLAIWGPVSIDFDRAIRN